jgi:hypothetical protein
MPLPPPRKRFRRLWRRVYDGVRYLLMQYWHPLEGCVPYDEYDSYALTVAGKLLRGSTSSEISDYLEWAEHRVLRERIGKRATHETTVEHLVRFRADGYPAIAWKARFPGTWMLPAAE